MESTAAEAPQPVGSVAVPPNLSAGDFKETITAVVWGRQWTVREVTDDVTGYLKHRGREAIMTINYSAAKVDLVCQGWEIDDNGNHTKFVIPTRWINLIERDLTKGLLDRSSKR